MSTDLTNGDGEDASASSETKTRWEGYSDYKRVSGQVAKSIDDAMEAYAAIDSAHAEGARVGPDMAAEARSRILSAAMKLVPELENDRGVEEQYDEILGRWQGEEGYLNKLDETQLTSVSPGWLRQFAIDIRTAGWELGYLQAGREQREEEDDPVTRDTEAMFRG